MDFILKFLFGINSIIYKFKMFLYILEKINLDMTLTFPEILK